MRSDTAPVVYLVAERREGRWQLGEDWVHPCDTLDEARQVVNRWRQDGYGSGDFGVLAVTVVEGTDA